MEEALLIRFEELGEDHELVSGTLHNMALIHKSMILRLKYTKKH